MMKLPSQATAGDYQKQQSSNGPRVSFNRDVHVKRIENRSNERANGSSRDQFHRHIGSKYYNGSEIGPEKFYSLPVRKKNPKSVKRSLSDVSSKKSKIPPFLSIFGKKSAENENDRTLGNGVRRLHRAKSDAGLDYIDSRDRVREATVPNGSPKQQKNEKRDRRPSDAAPKDQALAETNGDHQTDAVASKSRKKSLSTFENMHSSQMPAERPVLTRGLTVDGMVKRLSLDRFSPPPHISSPAFSYTRPNETLIGTLDDKVTVSGPSSHKEISPQRAVHPFHQISQQSKSNGGVAYNYSSDENETLKRNKLPHASGSTLDSRRRHLEQRINSRKIFRATHFDPDSKVDISKRSSPSNTHVQTNENVRNKSVGISEHYNGTARAYQHKSIGRPQNGSVRPNGSYLRKSSAIADESPSDADSRTIPLRANSSDTVNEFDDNVPYNSQHFRNPIPNFEEIIKSCQEFIGNERSHTARGHLYHPTANYHTFYRERSIDDGSYFDARLDNRHHKHHHSSAVIIKPQSRSPEIAKKDTRFPGLQKVKLFFSSGTSEDVPSPRKPDHQVIDISTRRRLSTPKASPLLNRMSSSRKTKSSLNLNSDHHRTKPEKWGWFKSLDRNSKNKSKSMVGLNDENRQTIKEDRTSRHGSQTLKQHQRVGSRKVRYFGDTDMESDPPYSSTTNINERSVLRDNVDGQVPFRNEHSNEFCNSSTKRPRQKLRNQVETNDRHVRYSPSKRYSPAKNDDHRYSTEKLNYREKSVSRDLPPPKPARSVPRKDIQHSTFHSRSLRNQDAIHENSGTDVDSIGNVNSPSSIVYLHATTIGDIPQPYSSADSSSYLADEVRKMKTQRNQPMIRTVARSVSMSAPWKPKHISEGYDIHYNNPIPKYKVNGRK